MSASSPDETAFLDWFKSKGGTVHPAVGLKHWEGMGRGAVALQDIEPDTLLFSIPRSVLLTTSTASLQSLLSADDWSSLSGWTPLILSMMREYLRTSTWTPYFALLPTSFDSLMFWSESELAELEGSTVLGKVGRAEADEEFETTVVPFVRAHEDVFGSAEEYTAELFHRMGSLVLSRSFHVESKEQQEDDEESSDDEDEEEEEREDVADVAMVPFADILNAKSGCDNARLFYEPTTLNMMSTSRIPAGAQIFNTYADPPNSDLLRRYGHVDEVNDADLVEVGLETVVDLVGEAKGLSEEEWEARVEWLLEMGIDDTFSIETNHKLPDEMISAIRTFTLDDAEWAKARKKESPPKPKIDADVAEWARKILTARRKEYKTSIEEDEALLADSTLPLRKRMAVIVRLGEKRILAGAQKKLDDEFPPGAPVEKAKEKKEKKRKGEDGAKSGSKKVRR
ncbi:ribosomal lysine N-methyltransferase [Rhodotorula paludigena]|uniref:ribosomal lysine N-methyltransferase n=1 Tax=Rhodotorula paludigena TaxID=86838 RepID=UPI00316CBC94